MLYLADSRKVNGITVDRKDVWIGRFFFLYLLMLSGSLYQPITRFSGADARSTEAGIYVTVICVFYGVGILLMVLVDYRRIFRQVLKRPMLLIFFSCGVISYVASPFSGTLQLIKFLMYVFTGVFGFWAATRYTASESMHAFMRVCRYVVILHWILFPFLYGQIDYDYIGRSNLFGFDAYGGGFGHKNLAGAFLGAGMAIIIVKIVIFNQPTVRDLVLATILFASLLVANSANGLISALVAIAVAGFVRLWLTARRMSYAIFFMLAVAVAILFNGGWDSLLGALGRDPSLTGRTALYAAWPYFFWQQPAFGYGFAGFFVDSLGVDQRQLQAVMMTDRTIGTFESSYLEALIQFGFVGAFALAIVVLLAFRNALHLAALKSLSGLSLVAILVFIIVHSISDTYLLLHNQFFFAVITFAFGLRVAKPSRSAILENPQNGGLQA
ncbi:MAG: exopolysaccharide biosynthesis protein [Devosia sp.]|nr:exopolysaccharide biosynthesis protein [Devosia sp.]